MSGLRFRQFLLQIGNARLACYLDFRLLLLQALQGLVDFLHTGIDFLLHRRAVFLTRLALRLAQFYQLLGDICQLAAQIILLTCGLFPFTRQLFFQILLLALGGERNRCVLFDLLGIVRIITTPPLLAGVIKETVLFLLCRG